MSIPTTRWLRRTGLAACLLLAACSAGETPRQVQPVAPAEAMQQFGALRVRYNALPSLAVNDAMASAYGIERGAGKAMVIVALRQLQGAEELPAQGQISGMATDLSGRRQPIAFRTVRTGDYVDHVGVVEISRYDSLRFVLTVQSAQGGGTVRFERSF